MFQSFFQLRANPFGTNPDPRYLFLTRDAQEALACLTYGIQARKGFIVLTGEVGTGKTTLLNKLLDWLHGYRTATAFLVNSSLTVPEFLDFMMADFGIACESPLKSQILLRLNRWLLERYRAGEAAVLIVDEAQNLSREVLEEIRQLTNLETSTEKLLQIVLSGQPELEEMLKQPQLRQLRQRVNLRATLQPLTLEEARGYVAERLRVAGANGQEIFTPEAIEKMHACSSGIPRLMNLVGEHALISAFADQEKWIEASRIEQVARDLGLNETWARGSRDPGSPVAGSVPEEVLRQLAIAVERIRRTQPSGRDSQGRTP